MVRFRMLDDDGELYYRGLLVGDFGGLEPLDDFGAPNSGCTELQIYTRGKGWESI